MINPCKNAEQPLFLVIDNNNNNNNNNNKNNNNNNTDNNNNNKKMKKNKNNIDKSISAFKTNIDNVKLYGTCNIFY